MDDPGHLDVLHRGVRRGHVDHKLGALLVAGLGQVDAVAAPGGVPFDAVVCLGVVGGIEAQVSRWQGVAVSPAQPPVRIPVVVVVDPRLAQDLELRQQPQVRRAGCGPGSGEDLREWSPLEGTLVVVEVDLLRSESEQRDCVEKRRAYAEAGILVYLLVDCDTCEVVVHSEPDGKRYETTVPLRRAGRTARAGRRHAGHRAAQGLGALTLTRPLSALRAPVTGR
ncbi:Uma2 family endonuclease [Streptomyces sp. R41]|uniref:Uma2 family endonuclease n=1 Tax=Streptomyces sp. R41 TaxID=3238632 RepID=A0AB39R883_9ACTN